MRSEGEKTEMTVVKLFASFLSLLIDSSCRPAERLQLSMGAFLLHLQQEIEIKNPANCILMVAERGSGETIFLTGVDNLESHVSYKKTSSAIRGCHHDKAEQECEPRFNKQDGQRVQAHADFNLSTT